MTTLTDIVNRALQVPGTRTSVTDAELSGNTSNEAIQANLALHATRKRLLRMAPWGCGLKTENLKLITSAPGTPQNQSTNSGLWARGLPAPPWLYEYQMPNDCLATCFIIPVTQTGFSGNPPITSNDTSSSYSSWAGAPVKFQVQTDTFRPVNTATVVAGGLGHAAGDIITLPYGASTDAPIGAPVQLEVATIGVGGVILTVDVVSQVIEAVPKLGGSYFNVQTNPIAQDTTTGIGTGATFNIAQGPLAPQRIILTNQENAIMIYVRDVSDPNVMDDLFQEAWALVLGATLTLPLTGDKRIANGAIQQANAMIEEARATDAGEGLTINDVTPDWIRIRGVDFGNTFTGPTAGYDWGGLWPVYG